MPNPQLPDNLIAALQRMFPRNAGDRVFIVGGTVRDALLGKQQQDIDLLAALPDKTLLQCGFRLVKGQSTQPIWFRSDPVLGSIEVTAVNSPDRLHDDLIRRDFTVNAIALSLDGQLHDPLGGHADLLQRRLAACSEACFVDDPLRLFRAFRFEADGWRLSHNSLELLAGQDWTAALQDLPVERFSRELIKTLAAANPVRFFERMLQFGLGYHWLPELFKMQSVPAGPLHYHPEGDLLSHSLQTLQRAVHLSPDPLTRFCSLFHDLGKLQTKPEQYPHHHGHDQAGAGLAPAFCNRLRLPVRYRRALTGVNRLHTTISLWDTLRDATRLRVAEQALKAGIAGLLPLVAQADQPGAGPTAQQWRLCLDAMHLTTAELGISQEQLSGLRPQALRDLILNRRIQKLRDRNAADHA